MDLHNQIVAVERATTANRSIDGDVAELLNLQPQGLLRRTRAQPELFSDTAPGARARTWLAPKLTISVDAALDMMSREWRLDSLSDASNTHRARCILERNSGDSLERYKVVGYGCNRATAALAAVLRSKAYDRGSPMPRSNEFYSNLETAVQPAAPEVMHA
jgi:hypothetical protein